MKDEQQSNESNEEENSGEDEVEEEERRIYKGHLTNPQRIEIFNKISQEILIKGQIAFANFTHLIYKEDPKIVAASICNDCQMVFAEANSARSSL